MTPHQTDTIPLAWLRSTVEAATEGTWTLNGGYDITTDRGPEHFMYPHDADVAHVEGPLDAQAIVTLHNLAPSLLAVVEAAQADREAHRAFQAAVNESQAGEGLREAVAHMEREEALDAALATLDRRVEEERA